MMGLAKRMKMPEDITLDQAKELKINMQERVMELWNEHQKIEQITKNFASQFDMERILQILECVAEDELYFENGLEIEQLELLIQQQQKQLNLQINNGSSNDTKQLEKKPSITGSMSAKRAVRMSIFTIDEEDEGIDE